MIVVVLGHRLVGPTIHPHLRRRVDAAVDALRATGAPKLVCSGGRRNAEIDSTEAAVMGDRARERGVPSERLLLERRSLDTIGNAYFTRRLLDRRGTEPETILLVTTDRHADRAAFAFEQCFGDVQIDTSVTVEPPQPDSSRRESAKPHADARTRMERTRAFFDSIEPGDRDAIARRLVDAHDCYGPSDVPDAPSPHRSV